MIRSSGVFLIGKNKFRVPASFKKRECIPNQIFVNFCDLANSKQKNMPSSTFQNSDFVKKSAALEIFKSLRNSNHKESQDELLKYLIGDKNSRTTSDILTVLKLFAKTSSRDIYILKMLCDALVKRMNNEVLLTSVQCSDVLFSLSKLSYLHEELIRKSTEMLKSSYLESDAVIKSVARSLASLRHRDLEALNLLLKCALKNFEPTTASNMLLALGLLNYSPSAVDELIQPMVSLKDIDFKTTKEYINFIWACVLLDKHNVLKDYHLPNILSEGFNNALLYGGADLNIGAKLKLWNISGAASQLQSYKGPLLVKDSHLSYITLHARKRSDQIFMSLSDALSHIVSKNGKLNLNVDTGAGFVLDIECHMNSKSSKTASRKSKIGIMIMNYKDMCSDGEYTGLFAFKLRILKGLQYQTVVVPYHEFIVNSKLSEKIFYLQNKIEAITKNNVVEKNQEKLKNA